MVRSTSLRLAALFTAAFALAVAVLGATTILAMRSALARQFDARIAAESDAVKADYDEGGIRGLIEEFGERRGNPGELSFGLQRAGQPIDGALARLATQPGWSTVRLNVSGRPRTLRVLAKDLPGGYRLLVADDIARMQALEQSVVLDFGLAFLAVIVIGGAGSFALSRAVQARLSAISRTAEAIIDGDLARRVPLSRADDEFSRLAQTINRMLDRIAVLMDSLRQGSSNIAHDLRTPLTRLRQRLERAAQGAEDPSRRGEIESALHDVDAILATFAALLRIAEIEVGARRAAFRRLDLDALARTVAQDFAPAAEDCGRRLTLQSQGPVWIDGDAELLTQMIVNLVENALRHTPPGAQVRVAVCGSPTPILAVIDDGPGVPEAERQRLFDRFHRLERSRSTPGAGLGLSLVAAIAWLHRAEIVLLDARPGLEAQARFPAAGHIEIYQ